MNTAKPQNTQNIYQNQLNQKTPATHPRNVWQDKGALPRARAKAHQPDPPGNTSRADVVNTQSARSQNGNSTRVKLVHTTLHLHPLVRRLLEQQAAEAETSISAIGAQALYDWATSTIERQHETTLKVEFRQIIREELQSFGRRLVFFLMRIAIASEQARILVTNVLKIFLQSRGNFDQKSYYTMVDESAKLARRNALKNTPQIKTLIAEWEETYPQEANKTERGEGSA